ncbi:TPA: hypothetical protein P6R03_005899 [Pseudomonas aeruginosa]|uniref:hypothetical protein n=1 Tax=Bacillus mobilis TaxID=2026190 RepID=UPI0022DFFB66|nr:hypothetical protein [Bacillus mobilis]HDP4772772.1 hypothetical protein [Pseudomonas aeruginosa]HDP4779088.1 hypothetical protein [Pseudomonas aeruginosa]HDP4811161.1 hypothetical protein [Pseudomonas aeruginosa]HDP4817514.1 hypothetical protein [Pseudomonas aeruginosa]HDP4823621.1 hypothetical protein [Pseudomonas aeruginosa]
MIDNREEKKNAFFAFLVEKMLFECYVKETTSIEEKAVYERFIALYNNELQRLNYELTIASLKDERANL